MWLSTWLVEQESMREASALLHPMVLQRWLKPSSLSRRPQGGSWWLRSAQDPTHRLLHAHQQNQTLVSIYFHWTQLESSFSWGHFDVIDDWRESTFCTSLNFLINSIKHLRNKGCKEAPCNFIMTSLLSEFRAQCGLSVVPRMANTSDMLGAQNPEPSVGFSTSHQFPF